LKIVDGLSEIMRRVDTMGAISCGAATMVASYSKLTNSVPPVTVVVASIIIYYIEFVVLGCGFSTFFFCILDVCVGLA